MLILEEHFSFISWNMFYKYNSIFKHFLFEITFYLFIWIQLTNFTIVSFYWPVNCLT